MPAIQNTSTEPIAIKPTRFEVKAGKLSPQNLEIAIRALHEDGLIVVENIFDHMRLNKLNEKMVEDAYELQARKENSPYNYNRGNIQVNRVQGQSSGLKWLTSWAARPAACQGVF